MAQEAADEGDAAPTLPTALERPIDDPAEDKLERAGFIHRLAEAVIARSAKKATGVIIGITGPWGSGKSSILNLLAKHLTDAYPRSIVVRFDPWLISGRNDLRDRKTIIESEYSTCGS